MSVINRKLLKYDKVLNAKNYSVHLSMKHIEHQDAVLVTQPNQQLSSWFSVAQTVRPLVGELMSVDNYST